MEVGRRGALRAQERLLEKGLGLSSRAHGEIQQGELKAVGFSQYEVVKSL